MSFSQNILVWIANRLKIPSDAMEMFKASNEISGIDKKTLPVELIPLNSIQLSRGLLNFTVLQSRLNWIFPFWINQQYNPSSKSFIPRSHLGLSMNITHRNWTAVGNPDCNIEPIVDPRGLVTPFKNGWSIDVWLAAGNEIFFPSASSNVEQSLIDNLPVVNTKFIFNRIELQLITYSFEDNLYHKISAVNNSLETIPVQIIIAVRPFNPEGISLLNKIEFNDNENCFTVNNSSKISRFYFASKPDFIHCSNFKEGDSALILSTGHNGKQKLFSTCTAGMANGFASFRSNLSPSSSKTVEVHIPLNEKNKVSICELSKVKLYWENYLKKGAEIKTPDEKLNSILAASISTLLMLSDIDTITPGPFTYHQFWFRDAAYMLWALDNLGYHETTRKIIENYPSHQTKDGYFRSQKGEWDSNGQAIWTIFRHYSLTKDLDFLSSLFDPLFRAVKWISNKRLTDHSFSNETFFGLMPAGMSAEHLGLADHYFWDNFWSLAGIKAFMEICRLLGKENELKYAVELNSHYSLAMEVAIENVQKKYSLNAIPASPSRGVDCGMIGSICASYPLQLFEAGDNRIISSLNILKEKYFVNGLFFQHFIHSGMNPYLTLQIAHSYLFAGKRELFWNILNNVLSYSSSTNNFPEAIHPNTSGGAMGDGHHGWAAAEIVLAVHDAFVFENNYPEQKEVIFLQGIPKKWFFNSPAFYIKNAPVIGGRINLLVSSEREINEIKLNIDFNGIIDSKIKWRLSLPFEFLEIMEGNDSVLNMKVEDGNSLIDLIPGSAVIRFTVQFKEHIVSSAKLS